MHDCHWLGVFAVAALLEAGGNALFRHGLRGQKMGSGACRIRDAW
jgi:hypothetical protein